MRPFLWKSEQFFIFSMNSIRSQLLFLCDVVVVSPVRIRGAHFTNSFKSVTFLGSIFSSIEYACQETETSPGCLRYLFLYSALSKNYLYTYQFLLRPHVFLGKRKNQPLFCVGFCEMNRVVDDVRSKLRCYEFLIIFS